MLSINAKKCRLSVILFYKLINKLLVKKIEFKTNNLIIKW